MSALTHLLQIGGGLLAEIKAIEAELTPEQKQAEYDAIMAGLDALLADVPVNALLKSAVLGLVSARLKKILGI